MLNSLFIANYSSSWTYSYKSKTPPTSWSAWQCYLTPIVNPECMNKPNDSDLQFMDLSQKTILVAEDVADNYVLIHMMLRKFNPTLLHVSNGEEAIRKLSENPNIDLILMDIRMPVLDGYEATKIIRITHPDLPIIALTAHAFEEGKKSCQEAGCSGYISKPIHKETLYNLIFQLLFP
jgi:CheY-like chemotaxis protein